LSLGIVGVPGLVDCFDLGLGVDLVVRDDHVARTALLGGEDIGRLSLAVDNPSGFNQMRLKGVNVVWLVSIRSDEKP